MSAAISTLQQKIYPGFYIEKPTQSEDKRLLIEQSSEGLKISVQQDRMAYPVKKHLIEGLPKIDLIPREFFESCYARVSKLGLEEYKVYFSMRLRGGMLQAQATGPVVPVRVRVANIPRNLGQIEEFYRKPQVEALKNQLLKSGSYRLGDVIDFMQTGASALNIAYLATSRSGMSSGVVEVKYKYTDLVSGTASSFIEMQTNNIKIVQGHIDANDCLSIGRIDQALASLRESKGLAQQNLDRCKSLEGQAKEIHGLVTSLGGQYSGQSDQILKDKKQKETLQNELREIKRSIESLEQKVLQNINETHTTQVSQKRARVANFFTLGLFGLAGGKTDYGIDQEKLEQDRKEYYRLKTAEGLVETKLIAQMREVSHRLNLSIGNLDSPELAIEALNMALMGIDEVRSGLESYQQFMQNVLSYTDIAVDNLQKAIEWGGNLDQESAAIFEEKFAYSGNYWLGIGALGDICMKSLRLVHEDVCERLRLKETDFSKHLDLAKKEIKELNTALEKRSKTRDARGQLVELLRENPVQSAEIARLTIPEGVPQEIEVPEGF